MAFDGTNSVTLNGPIWQNISTVPGRDYILKFAGYYGWPQAYWEGKAVTNVTYNTDLSGWYYFSAQVTANVSPSELRFAANANATLDAVSLGWLEEPIQILVQPPNQSASKGGSVTYTVVAQGGPPLYYQWFFNSVAIVNRTNATLTLTNVGTTNQGSYFVTISNVANSVTSSNCSLTIAEPPKAPVIVFQPEGDTVPAGYGCVFDVVALGDPPLAYAWSLNGTNLPGATNSSLEIASATTNNSGGYTVLVSNQHGTALSLPAILSVTNVTSGGYVKVDNMNDVDAPVFDVDGATGLSGTNYVAQLYAGATSTILRRIGGLMPFYTDPGWAGYFAGGIAQIPDVPPFQTVYVQLRVWDTSWGASYEEARARGGKFGFSDIYTMSTFPIPALPVDVPLSSFHLRAGLPAFTTGHIELVQVQPDGGAIWNLIGEPGFLYLVEKRILPHNWVPLVILTNITGTVQFTDPDKSNSSVKFYRSRMLD